MALTKTEMRAVDLLRDMMLHHVDQGHTVRFLARLTGWSASTVRCRLETLHYWGMVRNIGNVYGRPWRYAPTDRARDLYLTTGETFAEGVERTRRKDPFNE